MWREKEKERIISVTGKDKDEKQHYAFISQLNTVKRKVIKR